MDSISDLYRDGEVYLVTRERLKLGHAYRGVSGRCPKCAAFLPEDADTNARRRLRCTAVQHLPANLWAEWTRQLAQALLPAAPTDGIVQQAIGNHRTLRRRAQRPAGSFTDLGLIRQLAVGVGHKLLKTVSARRNDMPETMKSLGILLLALADALGRLDLALRFFHRLDRYRKRSYYGYDPVGNTVDTLVAITEDLQQSSRPQVDALLEALELIAARSHWTKGEVCGEPLFQATGPARYPLARYISRRCRDRFDLVVLDEVHEASNKGTAQQKSLHRLIQLGAPVLAMTGTIGGGYPSSLFANLQALSPDFRRDFARNQQADFVRRYGLEVVEVRARKDADPDQIDFGSMSDRERHCKTRRLREAPDIMPEAILRYILRQGVIMHLSDLEDELPEKTEHVHLIEPETQDDRDLLRAYRRLLADVKTQMGKDRFTAGRAGKLGGALAQLGSYLDRSALGPYVVAYPDGEAVATGEAFSPETITAKEQWLLDTLQAEIAEGRRSMVFLRHTRTGLAQRLQTLIAEHVTERVAFLDSQKVSTRKRQAWIDRQVHKQRAEVLIVNPVAVATGLNNLAKCSIPDLPGFSTAIWYQLCYDARVCRQAADGRLLRIGQTQPVRIHYAAWAGTTQAIGLDLVRRKIEASRRVDGLTVRDALSGATADEDGAVAALAIGQAILRRLEAA